MLGTALHFLHLLEEVGKSSTFETVAPYEAYFEVHSLNGAQTNLLTSGL
jgi:hypothetical protein